MKLGKAIKLIEELDKGCGPEMGKYKKALQLGIKALERVKWHKQQHINGYYELLPGETKD